MSKKEKLWDKQQEALRKPEELFACSFENGGITNDTLKYHSSKEFNKLLKKLDVTLIVSREYENLLLSLRAG